MKVTLETSDIKFEIICCIEDSPIDGNVLASGNDKTDSLAEERVKRQFYDEGNEWAWCMIQVQGTYNHLTVSDYLGCCSYASQEQFEATEYFESMKAVVKKELEDKLTDSFTHTLEFLTGIKESLSSISEIVTG